MIKSLAICMLILCTCVNLTLAQADTTATPTTENIQSDVPQQPPVKYGKWVGRKFSFIEDFKDYRYKERLLAGYEIKHGIYQSRLALISAGASFLVGGAIGSVLITKTLTNPNSLSNGDFLALFFPSAIFGGYGFWGLIVTGAVYSKQVKMAKRATIYVAPSGNGLSMYTVF